MKTNGKNLKEKPGAERLRRNGITPGNPGNSGGKPGRSGRKTLGFKAEMENLRDEKVAEKLRTKIEDGDPDDPAWRWAVDRVLEYTTSKAPQKQQHMGPDGKPLAPTQVNVFLGDNGRGISPPARIGNGNGAG